MLTETEVLLKTHRFLLSECLANQAVSRLYTDAHPTLTNHKPLDPFQRFTLDLGDFVLHPDLVGQLADGETLFAVEAKGSKDLIKGLAQAEMYQVGFHYSFLAAEASKLTNSHIQFAHRKNLGVIAVGDTVNLVHTPEAQMPLRDPFQFISRQMDSVNQISQGQTFQYNIPTHYLVWAIVLHPRIKYRTETLPKLLAEYPMPQGWRAALASAQKLGLVRQSGNEVQLTAVGEAVHTVLPQTVAEWTEVHQIVGARGSSIPLVTHLPQIAAVLRLLLLRDSMVGLVIAGLEQCPNFSAHFASLAMICDGLDHARTPIFFLKPESAAKLTDDQGRVHWENAVGQDYRSRMFYQYKSILKHAGILKPVTLGGASTKGYNPTRDIWALT
jgi:hypothetical protein